MNWMILKYLRFIVGKLFDIEELLQASLHPDFTVEDKKIRQETRAIKKAEKQIPNPVIKK